MQITSEAYKSEQKKQLRNEQFVNVYLGVVSKEAQANAEIDGRYGRNHCGRFHRYGSG